MSVSDNLYISDLKETFSCVVHSGTLFLSDIIIIVSAPELGDPIDDQINSISKVDLCTPSICTRSLNEDTLSC